MFTLKLFGKKTSQPNVYRLHAATLGSTVLRDKNTLEAGFQAAIIPEDQLIEDAAVRTLTIQNSGSDIELSKLSGMFRGLRGSTHSAPPPHGARGNMDDIQNRLTPQTTSLASLQSAYIELVEAGWDGAEMGAFGKALNDAYAKVPGLKEIKQAFMNLDIAIDRFHNVSDRHEQITVLSSSEVQQFNALLSSISGKSIEETLTEIGDVNTQVLE
jgi:hypothetical protein